MALLLVFTREAYTLTDVLLERKLEMGACQQGFQLAPMIRLNPQKRI